VKSPYTQIWKMELEEKVIDSVCVQPVTPLPEDYTAKKTIKYKRHIFPRDYTRKKVIFTRHVYNKNLLQEMIDWVEHEVGGPEYNRVIYSHNITDLSELPYYYFQVSYLH
jgi:hypothetical protein